MPFTLTRLPPKAWLLMLLAAMPVLAVLHYGPILQADSYHRFADARTLLGTPHFWNVISNLPFLLVGGHGLWLLARGHCGGSLSGLRPAYWVFFAGVSLVALGSGYYHLHPGNAALVWDRLPMTLAFTALFVAVMAERVHPGWVGLGLLPATVVGVVSVAWWHISGDLRLYVLVQFIPVILIPVVLVLYPSRLPGASWVWGLVAAYVAAKGLEHFDAEIYRLLEFGGHGMKHVAAAVGVGFVAAMIKARNPQGIDSQQRCGCCPKSAQGNRLVPRGSLPLCTETFPE